MRQLALISFVFLLLLACSSEDTHSQTQIQPYDHAYSTYAAFLSEHVSSGQVAYAKIKAQPDSLTAMVEQIGTADLASATPDQLMAFYCNAYNILTIRSIVDAYPVPSIQDIDGVWDDKKWLVAGSNMTLNDIEHNILRKNFTEPRIHVAVNCASIGCPPLLSAPFYPESLDSQLTVAATGFANSSVHNIFDASTRTARISSIFDWYGDDFVERYYDKARQFSSVSKKENAALNFLIQHRPTEEVESLLGVEWRIHYLDYDWSLNDKR